VVSVIIVDSWYPRSQAPKAVAAWREELKARPKIAGSIAHPDEHASLFTEGWEASLHREQQGEL